MSKKMTFIMALVVAIIITVAKGYVLPKEYNFEIQLVDIYDEEILTETILTENVLTETILTENVIK